MRIDLDDGEGGGVHFFLYLISSQRIDSDVIRDQARAGGFRFLPKPVDANRLRALVLALTRSATARGLATARR